MWRQRGWRRIRHLTSKPRPTNCTIFAAASDQHAAGAAAEARRSLLCVVSKVRQQTHQPSVKSGGGGVGARSGITSSAARPVLARDLAPGPLALGNQLQQLAVQLVEAAAQFIECHGGERSGLLPGGGRPL
jgi:hypothetical protein